MNFCTHHLVSFLALFFSFGAVAQQLTKERFFDAEGNFNYPLYLDELKLHELGSVKLHQKQIDSMGFSGRDIIYQALTQELFRSDSADYPTDSFAYLVQKLNLGRDFKTIGDWDTYDPILYKAIGDYWLEYVSNTLQNMIGENRDRVFEYDIRKIREGLVNCGFNFTLPPVSKYQKFFLEITEEYAWGHVMSRFWSRSPLYLKLGGFLGGIIFFIGLFTSFSFIKNQFIKQ